MRRAIAKDGGPTEAAWQTTVIELARWGGFLVAHFETSRTKSGGHATATVADGAGFPDLTLVRPPRLIFAELKREKGRLGPKQKVWLDYLRGVPGAEVYVWRPSDLRDVERVLAPSR